MFRRFQSFVLNENYIETNSCNTKVLPEGDSVVITKNKPVTDNVIQFQNCIISHHMICIVII